MLELPKDILFGNDAREKLLKGINTVADAVRVTLGPRGKNVVIDRINHPPHVTKDGVTVARQISFLDRFENMGAQLMKQVATKTLDTVGDGTTTATIFAAAIIRMGSQMLSGGSPQEFKAGLEACLKNIIDHLRSNTIPVKDFDSICKVATLAANGDAQLGELIAKAFEAVGLDGVVGIEESMQPISSLELVPGICFEQGYFSPSFVTHPDRKVCILEKPLILIYEHALHALSNRDKPKESLIPLLNKIADSGRSLLVMAEDFQGEGIHAFILNKMKGIMNVACCRLPQDSTYNLDMLADIAFATGAQIISDRGGATLGDVTMEMLGEARLVELSENRTVIMGGSGEEGGIRERVQELKARLEYPELDPSEKSIIEKRIARLTTGVAIVRVGSPTQVELKERKDRAEDAKYATAAAIKGGLTKGGGVGLLEMEKLISASLPVLSTSITPHQLAEKILAEVLTLPFTQLLTNAGMKPEEILKKIVEHRGLDNPGTKGWDVKTGQEQDFLEKGIMDPTEVLCSALEGAVSVASLVLSTETLISFQEDALNSILNIKRVAS